MVGKVIIVSVHVPYFSFFSLCQSGYVRLRQFTLEGRDVELDNTIRLCFDCVIISAGGRFEVDERSGVVRTRGTEPFQLDMEYVLYVKAEDQNGRDGRRYQVCPEVPDVQAGPCHHEPVWSLGNNII